MNELAMSYLIGHLLSAVESRTPGVIKEISRSLNSYDASRLPEDHISSVHDAQSWLWRNFTGESQPPTL